MRLILLCSALLILFGFAMLASASSDLGLARFGDPSYYFKHQLLYGATVGVLGFLIGLFTPHHLWRKWAVPLMVLGVILLLLVFTPLGERNGGAERWIAVGPISFQPSEFMKLVLVVYLAAWLVGRGERTTRFIAGFLPLLTVLGAVSFLILRQPATSTVIILLATAAIMYFAAGARFRYLAGIVAVGVVILGLAVLSTPYRLERLSGFLNPDADPERSGYQLIQARIAISSGGLWGVGYGNSTSKISSLPEPIGDSIFAVIAEELGFVGSFAMLAVFFLLVAKLFLEARRVRNKFGQLVLVGFGTVIGLHVFIHIGSISGIIPLTGIPLPFISYGGTALAVFMTMIGVAANITRSR